MTAVASIDRRAATWGIVAVLVAVAIAVLGSGNLRWFDAALVGYLFGTLFAIFAVVYRYLIWQRRPPTAMLNRRGWEAFRRPGRRGRNALALPGLVVSNLLVQSFIRGRSRSRWLAHLISTANRRPSRRVVSSRRSAPLIISRSPPVFVNT